MFVLPISLAVPLHFKSRGCVWFLSGAHPGPSTWSVLSSCSSKGGMIWKDMGVAWPGLIGQEERCLAKTMT